MPNLVEVFLLVLCAYMAGSTMGAYLISSFMNLPDPRQFGSRNPGTTNIYRLGGITPALFTLGWDTGKGFLVTTGANFTGASETVCIVVALACVAGHVWPIFYRLQGGKGVATAAGCGLALAPATTTVLLVIWGAIMYWRRISSVASLSCAALGPVVALWLNPDHTLLFLAMSAFMIWAHRENIGRLIRSDEPRL